MHAPSSLGNLLLLCYAKIPVNFCLPAERPHTILPVRHLRAVLKSNNIALTVKVCIASFEMIGELQREILRQSRATVFSWDG